MAISIMGVEAYCRFHKKHGVHTQTCPTNLFSAVHYILHSWEHGQLTGWPPRIQVTVAKSSILTMVHLFAAVTCHNWECNQYPVIQILDTITALYVTNLLLLCMRPFFSSAATKGWERYKHNAELVERAALLEISRLWQGVDAWYSKKEWREWIP